MCCHATCACRSAWRVFACCSTILAWPVQPETQRIYSPYQLLERTAKPDGLMQILSGGYYYQKVYQFGGEQARA